MIDPHDLNRRIDALNALLGAKLRLRGASFSARLARAGRLLPRRLRNSGQVILTAQENAQNPRLARLIDPAPVATAFSDFNRYLKNIDPAERRKTQGVRRLAGLVFNLIVISAAMLLILRWRGVI